MITNALPWITVPNDEEKWPRALESRVFCTSERSPGLYYKQMFCPGSLPLLVLVIMTRDPDSGSVGLVMLYLLLIKISC